VLAQLPIGNDVGRNLLVAVDAGISRDSSEGKEKPRNKHNDSHDDCS